MGLGAKNQKDEDVCALVDILKDEEKEQEEIKVTNGLMKELNKFFTK